MATTQKEKDFIQREEPGSIFCLQTDSRVSRVAQGSNYKTNVSWTLETSWIGSGHISAHGQREDLISSHVHFVWVFFFKANKKRAGSCGQNMTLTWQAETLPKQFSHGRSSTGYFSTENCSPLHKKKENHITCVWLQPPPVISRGCYRSCTEPSQRG